MFIQFFYIEVFWYPDTSMLKIFYNILLIKKLINELYRYLVYLTLSLIHSY